MNILNKYKLLNTHKFYIILAILIIFVFLYPYWIFGKYSALGWYDEVDGQIAWNYSLVTYHMQDIFIPQWAGGVGINLGYGHEYFSLYRFLLNYFNIFYVNLFLKFLNMFMLFIGMYIFLIKFIRIDKFIAFILSLFVISSSPYIYGWTFGGMGFDLSLIIWMIIAIFGNFKNISINFIIAILTIILGVSMSGPIFVFILFIFFLLYLYIINIISFSKKAFYLFIVFSIFSITIFIANWYYLHFIIINAKSFSARLVEIPTIDFFHYIYNKLDYFLNIWKYRFSNEIIFIGIYILFFLSIFIKNIKIPVLFIFYSIILPVILESLFKFFAISILDSYRWTVLWLLIPLNLSISLAFVIKQLLQRNYNKLVLFSNIVLSISIVYGMNKLISYTIKNLNSKGGINIIYHYKKLNNIINPHYRIITDYKTLMWAIPIYYNFSTFDGIQPAFSYRRNYFIKYAIFRDSSKQVHHSKQFFYFYTDKILYNKRMFEMANVKYIFSSTKKLFKLHKIYTINGVFYKNIKRYDILKFDNLSLVKDLNVFELKNPWGYIFIPKQIIFSLFSFKDKDFYKKMHNLNQYDIIIAKDDLNKIDKSVKVKNNLKIKNYEFHKNKFVINLNNGSGWLTINQVYLPFWHARCMNQRLLNIVPSNGIMMSVKVPINCKQVIFEYKEK